MIVGKDFLAKLKDFDLNSYEVKLWVALLSRGISTAGELSDIANVPRSRTYDVLESLEKKGFVMQKVGKPIKYMAIDPSKVIDILKKNIKTDAEVRAKMIDDIKSTSILKELQLLHQNGIEHVDASDLSGSIRGRSNLYNQIEQVLSSAEKTVTIMTTTRGFIEKVDIMAPTLAKLAKRGVQIRIAAPLTKECAKAVDDLKDVAQIRTTQKVGRFIIVDSQEFMFMITDDATIHPNYDVGIWVNSPFFAKTLEDLFEIAWAELKPVKELVK
jgi:HTH-type transcriptional regulator, sugar sensing transcriptional regulator